MNTFRLIDSTVKLLHALTKLAEAVLRKMEEDEKAKARTKRI